MKRMPTAAEVAQRLDEWASVTELSLSLSAARGKLLTPAQALRRSFVVTGLSSWQPAEEPDGAFEAWLDLAPEAAACEVGHEPDVVFDPATLTIDRRCRSVIVGLVDRFGVRRDWCLAGEPAQLCVRFLDAGESGEALRRRLAGGACALGFVQVLGISGVDVDG